MSRLKKIQNRILLVLMVPVFIVLHGFGDPSGTDESAVKAMFIYNFSKYFDWDPIAAKPEFVIGVYGSTPVAKYLNEIAHRKTINGKPIIIKLVLEVSGTAGCQMLFIPHQVNRIADVIRDASANQSLIIITENDAAIKKGAHINLINVDGKLRFELNETLMRSSNIKFSRDLTVLSANTN